MAGFLHKTVGALILIFTITCLLCNLAASSKDFMVQTICLGNPTKDNSTYPNNARSLLSKLSSESSSGSSSPLPGYFNTTVGEGSDKAYGSYLCRGDIDDQLCRDCVVNVTRDLMNKDVSYECYGFDDQCMVHFARHSIFSVYQKGYVFSYGSRGYRLPNYSQYNITLSTTFEGLVREAAFGNWTRTNFATRVANVTESDEKIYSLVQCSPDISAKNCSACLGSLYAYIPRCCTGTPGGQVIHANCMIKYDNQSFFGGDAVFGSTSGGFGGFMMASFLHSFVTMFLSFYLIIYM